MQQKKTLSTRGRKFTGIVISDKMSRTVTVQWEGRKYDSKYERYEKKRTKIKAHNPDNMAAVKGDLVTIEETRPISKTKNFIVTQIHAKGMLKEKEEDPTQKKSKPKKDDEE